MKSAPGQHQPPATSHTTQEWHRKRHLKTTLYPVTFRIHAAHAHSVSVAGNFADGHPQPMQAIGAGDWQVVIELKRGRYEYRFLVDNLPTLDPKSRGSIVGHDGSKFSLLEVGF